MSLICERFLCQDAEQFVRIIFELIKGEMEYVKDLENIEVVRPKPEGPTALRTDFA